MDSKISLEKMFGKNIELVFDDGSGVAKREGKFINIFPELQIIVILNNEGFIEMFRIDKLIRIKFLEKI